MKSMKYLISLQLHAIFIENQGNIRKLSRQRLGGGGGGRRRQKFSCPGSLQLFFRKQFCSRGGVVGRVWEKARGGGGGGRSGEGVVERGERERFIIASIENKAGTFTIAEAIPS